MKHLILPTLLWLLLLSNVALGHTPLFLSDKGREGVHIGPVNSEPDYSWAYYGRLAPGPATLPDSPQPAPLSGRKPGPEPQVSGPSVEVLPLLATAGQELRVRLAVPRKPELQNFRPRVVVIGPGLPALAPDDPIAAELPVQPGPGEGVLLAPEDDPEATFEPFTQVSYWDYPFLTGTFPASAPYKIVVYDPQGVGGRYTIALGKRERLGPKDILTFPLTWARIRIWLWK